MSLIELLRTCTHDALIGAIDQVVSASSSPETLALHLPDGCFVAPCAMALLGAWGLHLREQGIRLSVVGNDDTRRYLSRMDVFQTLDIPFTETFDRHNAAGRFVPMKRIEGDSWKPAVDVVCDRTLRQLDDASSVLTVPVTTRRGRSEKKSKFQLRVSRDSVYWYTQGTKEWHDCSMRFET